MNTWNEINLKKPPLNTVPNQSLSIEDLKNLRALLMNAIGYYENQNEFDQSAALCSRLIARRKNSFKKMYGFKSFTKLNSSLCRLLKVDIKTNLKNFLGIMPDFMSSNITYYHVPTKTNFEYLLLKLLSLHKLYERISFCAKETAEYFTKLLHNNYFFDTLTLLLTTVSNLWSISNQIGIFTTDLYTNIIIYRKDFPLGKATTKDEFIFPTKINFTFSSVNNSIQEEIINVEIDKNYEAVLNEVEKQEYTEKLKDEKILSFTNSKLSVTKIFETKLNINEIKTTEEIRKFIQQESKDRKQNLKKCVTKKISDIYWKKSVKDILNKINLKDNKNAIKIFKYTIKNKI